jgi:hypothetical protein
MLKIKYKPKKHQVDMETIGILAMLALSGLTSFFGTLLFLSKYAPLPERKDKTDKE